MFSKKVISNNSIELFNVLSRYKRKRVTFTDAQKLLNDVHNWRLKLPEVINSVIESNFMEKTSEGGQRATLLGIEKNILLQSKWKGLNKEGQQIEKDQCYLTREGFEFIEMFFVNKHLSGAEVKNGL